MYCNRLAGHGKDYLVTVRTLPAPRGSWCNRLLSTVNSESPLSAKQKNFAPVPLHFATKPEQA